MSIMLHGSSMDFFHILFLLEYSYESMNGIDWLWYK